MGSTTVTQTAEGFELKADLRRGRAEHLLHTLRRPAHLLRQARRGLRSRQMERAGDVERKDEL